MDVQIETPKPEPTAASTKVTQVGDDTAQPPPSTPEIQVTPKAVARALDALTKRGTPGAMLRIGVRGGGCSGFSYMIEFADEATSRDRTFEFGGLKVLVDPKSLVFLRGTTLDYETKLMSHGFKLVNPNEKSSCGCGESFSV